MSDAMIYRDIAERTGGNIYIGVVGPVRTGKSTFIKRFLETMVLPEMEDIYAKERARDEMPQSGSGKTIMTAEPKFIPETAAEIRLSEEAFCRVRMVDSVGFMVSGAVGNQEDGAERMVMTPWYEEEIPMSRAAEEGTNRVIADHSTVGILLTTDGSICGIDRACYEAPEAKTAEALEKIGKPYVILLNCSDPKSAASVQLAAQLQETYGHTCMPVNCIMLGREEMQDILKCLLYEFEVKSYRIYLPQWLDALAQDHEVKRKVLQTVSGYAEQVGTIGDAEKKLNCFADNEMIQDARITELSLGTGEIRLTVELRPQLYYQTISGESGFEIRNDTELLKLLRGISGLKQEYERVHEALEDVRSKGYGIVMPTPEEMSLEEPQIVRQGGKYGVRLKASAPSIHMVMANIETEVAPAIGGERASEEVLSFLLQGYDGDMNSLWESNIFGKSLNDIAGDGLSNKIKAMPVDVQGKLRTTVQRIVNEGSRGLICILL